MVAERCGSYKRPSVLLRGQGLPDNMWAMEACATQKKSNEVCDEEAFALGLRLGLFNSLMSQHINFPPNSNCLQLAIIRLAQLPNC